MTTNNPAPTPPLVEEDATMNTLDLHAGMKRCRTCDMRFLPDRRESYCQHCKALMKTAPAGARKEDEGR